MRVKVEKGRETIATSSEKASKLKDEIYKKKEWPNQRGRKKIAELHAVNSLESLKEEKTTNRLSIFADLPKETKPVIVDLGMGSGQFLIDVAAKLRKKCVLIGVSATPNEIKKHAVNYAGIHIVKGRLPYDDSLMELLRERQGTVDKIFDTFGPGTYSSNPLHSLIYSAILAKPGGKFSAITSTEGNELYTVFGDEKIRGKIKEFFQAILGIDINFEFTSIRSEVTSGNINTDLLVTFTKGDKVLTADDYLGLCKLADSQVGVPHAIRRSWYDYETVTHGLFSIKMNTYKPFINTKEEQDPHKVSLI